MPGRRPVPETSIGILAAADETNGLLDIFFYLFIITVAEFGPTFQRYGRKPFTCQLFCAAIGEAAQVVQKPARKA